MLGVVAPWLWPIGFGPTDQPATLVGYNTTSNSGGGQTAAESISDRNQAILLNIASADHNGHQRCNKLVLAFEY